MSRLGCTSSQNSAAARLGPMIPDQIVNEVKTALDNGVADLQLPVINWDTVDAAWGTIWEKEWEAVANTPPRHSVDGIKHLQHTSTGWQHLLLYMR